MEAKYEYTPLYYGTPCQVKFYEGFEKQYRYGIAYHEEIFCGCCGLIYRIESVIRDAEIDGIHWDDAIVELEWVDLTDIIKG